MSTATSFTAGLAVVAIGLCLVSANVGATQSLPMDPGDLEYSGTAQFQERGVAVYDVVGQPNLKIVSYVKFAVHNASTGVTTLHTYSAAEAQLADNVGVTPVEVAVVYIASYIGPNDPILSAFPPNAEFLARYNQGTFDMLTLAPSDDPPGGGNTQVPCCCCTAGTNPECSWGCVKCCYRPGAGCC